MYRNGAGSLISLTFDDGLPSQIEHALPALDARGLPGTFFLIASPTTEYDSQFRQEVWRDAQARGHEIGSHSESHKKAAALNAQTASAEAVNSARFLANKLYTGPVSFCYPYTDAPDYLQRAVQAAGYKQARGGRGARADKYLQPGDGANLLNTPCFHVGPETIKDADEWITTTIRRGAWLTLMLHGVGNPNDWDNITVEQFAGLLDKLVAAKPQGLATVTYGMGGQLYRQGR